MTDNAPAYTFQLEMQVRDYEVDYEGIVNNSVYLNYFEHTRHEFCRQAGLSFAEMHRSGLDPVLRRAEIDYLHPLRSGDTFLSCMKIERRGARFIFIQDLFLLPERVHAVHAVITVASIENGRLGRGEKLAEVFAPYLSTSAR